MNHGSTCDVRLKRFRIYIFNVVLRTLKISTIYFTENIEILFSGQTREYITQYGN